MVSVLYDTETTYFVHWTYLYAFLIESYAMKPDSLGGTGTSLWIRQLVILCWINDGTEMFLFQYSVVQPWPGSYKLKLLRE